MLVIKKEHWPLGSEIKLQQEDKKDSNKRINYDNTQQRHGGMQSWTERDRRRMDGKIDRWVYRRIDIDKNRQTGRWTVGWTDWWNNGQTDGRTDSSAECVQVNHNGKGHRLWRTPHDGASLGRRSTVDKAVEATENNSWACVSELLKTQSKISINDSSRCVG